MLEAFKELVGQVVVVDTRTPMIYLGQLARIENGALYLEEVDVHDSTESQASKELYVIEAKKYGVKANRKAVRVLEGMVVSVSRLEDVIPF